MFRYNALKAELAAINLKTAEALGLTVPLALLTRACLLGRSDPTALPKRVREFGIGRRDGMQFTPRRWPVRLVQR
jgi:hypothetical protein